MNLRRFFIVMLLGSAVSSAGCSALSPGAHIKAAETTTEPSGRVRVHLTVHDGGKPVTYLRQNDFQVFENDVLLDSEQVGLRLIPPESQASGHTVLLLDLSESPTEEELHRMGRGAAHFVEKVSTTQPVIVIAFDGSERPREVARFSAVSRSTKRPLPPLESFISGDDSRNLNGAVIAGISGLSAIFKADSQSVHYGTLVVLARGPDLAGRKSDKELSDAIRNSGFEFFSITPQSAKISSRGELGRTGHIEYADLESLPLRFQDLGMQVRSAWQGHYLISYCSPGRAGIREVRVRVDYESESGSRRIVNGRSDFNASGFSGDCTPEGSTQSSSLNNAGDPIQGSPSPAGAGPSASGQIVPENLAAGSTNPNTASGDGERVVLPPPATGKYE